MDVMKMAKKAGKFAKKATITTLAGLGVIWGAKQVAQRTPVDIDEDILDELTGD